MVTYVQFDLQLWSLQGDPLYSAVEEPTIFYYFQHQHVIQLSKDWKFEPMSCTARNAENNLDSDELD